MPRAGCRSGDGHSLFVFPTLNMRGTPWLIQVEGLQCILQPGDVLFVPQYWCAAPCAPGCNPKLHLEKGTAREEWSWPSMGPRLGWRAQD